MANLRYKNITDMAKTLRSCGFVDFRNLPGKFYSELSLYKDIKLKGEEERMEANLSESKRLVINTFNYPYGVGRVSTQTFYEKTDAGLVPSHMWITESKPDSRNATGRIVDLKSKRQYSVGELSNLEVVRSRPPSKGDMIYEKVKEDLEKNHMGKVIAIDTDAGKVVGMGKDILTAYNEALKSSDKKQFAFRKVGYKTLGRV